MMWKPSSKQKKIINNNTTRVGVSMENHKIHQPHLSGAYISTIVKHLTCKQSSNEDQNKQPESPAHKKQVRRRRRDTTKPYQQRLLNMAEARKEIVTALKFHRASMKQQQTATATTVTALPPPLPLFNHQNLDFTLPKQTLGLNLNFQDFQILEEKSNLYHNPLSNFSVSSSSTSSAVISLTTEEVDAATVSSSTSTSSSCDGALMNGGLHHVMDDEELEEIRCLGEQHQMEWNDTVNLLTSARWFNFLKTIESEEKDGRFDEDVEFPHWLDIDEIEGMDGEWFA